MAEYVLENNILKVTVDSKGCEIRDVLCKTDNTHRMWNANPEGWKRVAPVLFRLLANIRITKAFIMEKYMKCVSTDLQEIWNSHLLIILTICWL